jgi:hypothetical protein
MHRHDECALERRVRRRAGSPCGRQRGAGRRPAKTDEDGTGDHDGEGLADHPRRRDQAGCDTALVGRHGTHDRAGVRGEEQALADAGHRKPQGDLRERRADSDKLVANSMLADIVLAAAELQVAGEDAGLDPDDVFWVLQRSAPLLAPRRRGFVDDHHEPTLFALRDLRKDIDLAVDLFDPALVRTPITAQARQLSASCRAASPAPPLPRIAR